MEDEVQSEVFVQLTGVVGERSRRLYVRRTAILSFEQNTDATPTTIVRLGSFTHIVAETPVEIIALLEARAR